MPRLPPSRPPRPHSCLSHMPSQAHTQCPSIPHAHPPAIAPTIAPPQVHHLHRRAAAIRVPRRDLRRLLLAPQQRTRSCHHVTHVSPLAANACRCPLLSRPLSPLLSPLSSSSPLPSPLPSQLFCLFRPRHGRASVQRLPDAGPHPALASEPLADYTLTSEAHLRGSSQRRLSPPLFTFTSPSHHPSMHPSHRFLSPRPPLRWRPSSLARRRSLQRRQTSPSS